METITKLSSQWASFLISSAVHWSLRNVYIQRSHGEQIVARGGLFAEHGVVSTRQQSENNVWLPVWNTYWIYWNMFIYLGWKLFHLYTKNHTTYLVNGSPLLLCIRAPENKNKTLHVSAEPVYHSVSESLPSLVFVRVGLVCAHSQHSVQQQNSYKTHSWRNVTEHIYMHKKISLYEEK